MQVLGHLSPTGRPACNPRLPASASPRASHCSHLGSEQRALSLSLSLLPARPRAQGWWLVSGESPSVQVIHSLKQISHSARSAGPSLATLLLTRLVLRAPTPRRRLHPPDPPLGLDFNTAISHGTHTHTSHGTAQLWAAVKGHKQGDTGPSCPCGPSCPHEPSCPHGPLQPHSQALLLLSLPRWGLPRPPGSGYLFLWETECFRFSSLLRAPSTLEDAPNSESQTWLLPSGVGVWIGGRLWWRQGWACHGE